MIRCAHPTIGAAVCLGVLGLTSPLAAQDVSSPLLRDASEATATQLAVAPPQPTVIVTSPPREHRPAPLVPLYLSFGALQMLDIHSTSGALDRGAVEANPFMKGLAGSPAGMMAIKAAGTTGVVYASEKMWKKNRMAAVIFMVATNSAMAWVVNHNYRAAR